MNDRRDECHADYVQALPDWEFMADAVKGERAIKERGEEYLPKTPGMILAADPEPSLIDGERQMKRSFNPSALQSRYDAYRLRAEFPEKTGPAIDAAVGLFTDKDAAFERPDAWTPVEEMATPDGDTVYDMHRVVSQEVAKNGRVGIWADVRENGLPYYVVYNAMEIINWSERVIGSEKVLDRIVIKIEAKQDGKTVQLLRDVTLQPIGVVVEEFIREKDADQWVQIDAPQPRTVQAGGEALANENGTVGGFRLQRIPFVFINAESTKPKVGRIPFLPLARQCLKVYRMDANYQEALSFYEPTPWVSGMTEEWVNGGFAPQTLGAGTIWYLPADAEAGMLEYTGPAIENIRQGITDALQRADELAMRPFEPKTVSVESGESKKERRKTQTSAAKVMAQNIGSGMQKVFRISAEWLGVPADKVSFEPSYDFVEAAMDAQTLTALVAAHTAGAYSKETLHENLQRGGITSKTFEEEAELIGKGL